MKLKFAFLLILFFNLSVSTAVKAQNWDVNLLKDINSQNPNSAYWRTTSASAYVAPVVVSAGSLVAGLVSNDDRLKHNALETFMSFGISSLISEGLKIGINRKRPSERYPDEIFVTSPIHGQSFPSGHTVLAFSTATTLALEYRKWYVVVPAYMWAGSISYSRMYMGKHYPSDVLGGMAVGIGGAYVTHWFNKKLFKTYYTKHNAYGDLK
jgi:membrane-associated phospholipid phosphatase